MDLAVVLGGGIALIVVLFALMVRSHLRRRRLRFTCPVIRENVECKAVQDVATGRWQDVEKCSAFTPPSSVHCDKKCLDHLNAGDLVAR